MATDIRVSGLTGGEEASREASEELKAPANLDLPEERAKLFSAPGFSRFKLEWREEHAEVQQRIQSAVDKAIAINYRDANEIIYSVYEAVREPEVGTYGEILLDIHGLPRWKRSVAGGYIEDYRLLTTYVRENLMFKITNALYDIEQRAAQAWLDAMLAKGIFEETFAQAYDSPSTGTIEARQSKAKMSAAQDRYWAIYLSAYSRRADAICRSLSLLGQRLKDSLNT